MSLGVRIGFISSFFTAASFTSGESEGLGHLKSYRTYWAIHGLEAPRHHWVAHQEGDTTAAIGLSFRNTEDIPKLRDRELSPYTGLFAKASVSTNKTGPQDHHKAIKDRVRRHFPDSNRRTLLSYHGFFSRFYILEVIPRGVPGPERSSSKTLGAYQYDPQTGEVRPDSSGGFSSLHAASVPLHDDSLLPAAEFAPRLTWLPFVLRPEIDGQPLLAFWHPNLRDVHKQLLRRISDYMKENYERLQTPRTFVPTHLPDILALQTGGLFPRDPYQEEFSIQIIAYIRGPASQNHDRLSINLPFFLPKAFTGELPLEGFHEVTGTELSIQWSFDLKAGILELTWFHESELTRPLGKARYQTSIHLVRDGDSVGLLDPGKFDLIADSREPRNEGGRELRIEDPRVANGMPVDFYVEAVSSRGWINPEDLIAPQPFLHVTNRQESIMDQAPESELSLLGRLVQACRRNLPF